MTAHSLTSTAQVADKKTAPTATGRNCSPQTYGSEGWGFESLRAR